MAALNRAATAAASGVLRAVDHVVPLRQGKRLFAREWRPPQMAKAEPIVLLHDSLGSVELWRGFPAALAQTTGRQVVAYDRLGFGRSGVREGVLPPTFIKEEAEYFLPTVFDYFRLNKVVLFGHSVGGAMAAACASRHPDVCAAVVTEGAPAFVEDKTVRGLLEAKANFHHAEQLDRLKRYHGERRAGWSTRGRRLGWVPCTLRGTWRPRRRGSRARSWCCMATATSTAPCSSPKRMPSCRVGPRSWSS